MDLSIALKTLCLSRNYPHKHAAGLQSQALCEEQLGNPADWGIFHIQVLAGWTRRFPVKSSKVSMAYYPPVKRGLALYEKIIMFFNVFSFNCQDKIKTSLRLSWEYRGHIFSSGQ